MNSKWGGLWRVFLLLVVTFGGPVWPAAAQSPDAYDVSFADIGYQDEIIYGPQGSVSFYFSLPASWRIVDGSYLTLDLEFQTLFPEGSGSPPAMVTVRFNNQTVHTEELLFPNTRTITVDLPANLFRLSESRYLNTVQVSFDEHSPCEVSTYTSLRIKNTSALHFASTDRPLQLDLTLLPKPMYQSRSFQPQGVRIILPDDFDAVDVRAAAIIAARLGQLTYNNLPITVTLASDLLAALPLDEHLIVVGALEENPIIDRLDLSVGRIERQLGLRSHMPGGVAPGATLSYTLYVENTARTSRSLVVEDRIPLETAFQDCGSAACDLVGPGVIRWRVGTLAPGAMVSTTVSLQVTSVVSPDTALRHTAALVDDDGGAVLNVDTLATTVTEVPTERALVSQQIKVPEFFVWEDRVVPEDAGVIEELVSPWSDRSAVLVVTGLTDDGLLKAAHGLNPANHFPGPAGTIAVVEDLRSPVVSAAALPNDLTFFSLGYEDVELDLINFEAADYALDLPSGAILGKNSYVVFHVSHAEMVSMIGGGVKVLLNGMPVGSFTLDAENLTDAWVRIPLNRTAVVPGTNRIRIETNVRVIDRCLVTRNNPYWLAIYKDSFVHLDFERSQSFFLLQSLPHPLNWPGTLENVLFVLPNAPEVGEVQGTLQAASMLGSGSASKDLLPNVIFGKEWDPAVLSNTHVFAVGRPTANPAIRDANAYLPQPFIPESDTIYQSIDSPIYGVLPGTDLGLVQELFSPWSSTGEHVLLAATGTTEKGVVWALSALSHSVAELQGNLTIVRDGEIHNTNTYPVEFEEVFDLTSLMTTTTSDVSSPSVAPVLTPSPASEDASMMATLTAEEEAVVRTPARPWWLLGVFVLGLVGIAASVFLTMRRRSSR